MQSELKNKYNWKNLDFYQLTATNFAKKVIL
ncbi:hypothetical protein HMPREF9455_01062 [Dysgonomonas gadei ATCC BAA-286]|uniref:Uncharacterized protein n=1 Tax=Dysgonomonas gadei ATCC BAA-286 TaxID=742766 RepID=F5IW12_9BACT|nr:hypothetical protein HMPREF9455_01062 [Dysgonomonas gadei ATCC BAA-286]